VTQQEHPTTEQLSAFLDKQLTPQEQAFFDAHLQSCQRCQGVLGELRRTVALLHAIPQPQLPRSFTLTAGTPRIPTTRPQQRRVLPYTLQRTMRTVSTLAAAVAVIFILSGLLTNYHLNAGESTSTGAPVNTTYGSSNGSTHPSTGPNVTHASPTTGNTPKAAASPIINGHLTGTPMAPSATTTPTPAATSKSASSVKGVPTNPPTLPPFLDISQPEGRLTLGALLLLLSIIGIIATRRRRDTVSY
jgi:Putative zinc-finger